jgi:hypothetical protein
MKHVIAASALLCVCATASVAHADVLIPGAVSGIVDDGTYTDSPPLNTSFLPGQTITGSFVWDATTDAFQTFTIGGYTAAPGYTTIYSQSLASTAFAYVGVQNPVANAGPSNALQIDFYYETAPGPSTADITSFIVNPGAYSQDLTGGSPSYFAVYLTNADGSVTQVDALLTFYAAPEPASLLLTLPALLSLAAVRRRRF